jgi:diaminopimelate decarboxylase
MRADLWGLERVDGRLHWQGVDLAALPQEFGSPLYVASARRLRSNARRWREAFSAYPGQVSVHYSYKTNSVARIPQILHEEGLGAEVVNGYELRLASELGVAAERVVLNGPNKSLDVLRAAVEMGVGLLVADGLAELERLGQLCSDLGRPVALALRVCPDIAPRRMNASSLTGSRKNQFGLDLESGEVEEAIQRIRGSRLLRLRGFMVHIGSGIHDLQSFRRSIGVLMDLQATALARNALDPDRPAAAGVIDVGGGLGVRLSREFTTLEMLRYLGTGHMPRMNRPGPDDLLERYASIVCESVVGGAQRRGMEVPDLICEPGRALVSDTQLLLLTVGAVRDRPGVGRFALTDGGAMSASMMFISEIHAVLLANRDAPADGRTSIYGALPSPMDVVYRNLPMPRLVPGDVLSIMDAGAYFTATSTNFGGTRPAVVLIDAERSTDADPRVDLIRRAERFEDLFCLDRRVQGPEAP